MKVAMVLPALIEASGPGWRPIKYSLFPPLGLATLAGYLDPGDDVVIQDEHVEDLDLDDDPDLVVIQVYITSAKRAYAIADEYRRRGVYVAMGGLHVTSLPDEAAQHADSVFLGPGEDTWPRFLDDFRARRPRRRYESTVRTLAGVPPVRRDLIRRELYLCPNSIVVSRGCPHHCDFCYKDAFFDGGRGFYTQSVDAALSEIDRLPGRHVYFLDDHLLGRPRFARELFAGMRGMGRLWQAASTVDAVTRPGLLEDAAAAGMRSVFVGFETLSSNNLTGYGKQHNRARDYEVAVRRIHDQGVMVNGSFVFGLDHDDSAVFDRTVEWAISVGIETATFHILTPYPGTKLFAKLESENRIVHRDWDRYTTRDVVYRPRGLTPEQLLDGYRRAYHDFYTWASILRGSRTKTIHRDQLRHVAYAGGWKKFEWLWDRIISARQVNRALPLLEGLLAGFGEHNAGTEQRRRVGGPARDLGSLQVVPLPAPPGVGARAGAVSRREPYAS